MNEWKPIKGFKPYLIANKAYKSIKQIPLQEILTDVTRHKLVLLRGFEALTRNDLLAYCQKQSALLSWDFGPVMDMKVDQQTKNYLFTEGDVPLHWDGAFHQEPRFLFFHCLQAPEAYSGGETLFVHTENVWESLCLREKEQWLSYRLSFSTEKLAHYGGTISRQLVNRHPDTQQTILRFAEPVGEHYLNPVQVKVINESEEASDKILRQLSRKMRAPQFCYAHAWQDGDYLIADNFSLLHGRNAFHKNSPRHLRRIQIL